MLLFQANEKITFYNYIGETNSLNFLLFWGEANSETFSVKYSYSKMDNFLIFNSFFQEKENFAANILVKYNSKSKGP